MERTTVLIVDDHALVREGLVLILQQVDDVTVVGEAQDGPSALRLAEAHRPDIVLLDLRVGEWDGIALCSRIRETSPTSRVIFLTGHEDGLSQVREAMTLGASGFLLKDISPAELVDAIGTVSRGQTVLHPAVALRLFADEVAVRAEPLGRRDKHAQDRLSPREKDVFPQLMGGLTNKEIAAALRITERTVKFHVSNILRKLGHDRRLTTLAQAVALGTNPEVTGEEIFFAPEDQASADGRSAS